MKKSLSFLLAMAATLSMLAGCGSADSQSASSTSAASTSSGASGEDKYYIACGAPFTGDDAQYGNFFKKALDMKAAEINEAGGINGKMIQIDYYDDKSTPKEASNIAQMVTSDSK